MKPSKRGFLYFIPERQVFPLKLQILQKSPCEKKFFFLLWCMWHFMLWATSPLIQPKWWALLELWVRKETGGGACHPWCYPQHFVLNHRNKCMPVYPLLKMQENSSPLPQTLPLYPIPGLSLHRIPWEESSWEEAAENSVRSWVDTGWKRWLPGLSAISWELIALKARLSHIILAVRMNSLFFLL